jgi:DNA (cytosine-5)-methyltransferase 1
MYYKVKSVLEAEQQKKFTVVSMFAGLGGSSTGYRLAGGHILAANEFMRAARSMYHANYPDTLIIPEDIRALTGEEILKRIGLKKGELDILDGSPPCAAFSCAGQRNKSWGKIKRYSYTNQRIDDLFFEFARILKEIQPKVFIAENTKGLSMKHAREVLGTTNKLDRFMAKSDPTILKTLYDCGYKLAWKVLNAADYGVAQKRERVFIIGVRKDIDKKPSFPHPTTLTHKAAKDVIWPFIFNGSEYNLNPKTKTYEYITKYIGPLTGLTETKKIIQENNLKTYKQRVVRDGWMRPHRTISQSDWAIHAIVDRYESVNESKLLQSFPVDYNLLGHPFKRIKVSYNDLKHNIYDYYNYQAGAGKLEHIYKISGLFVDRPDISLNCKVFYIDIKNGKIKKIGLGEPTAKDDNHKYSTWITPSRQNEFIGRAVPPLLMKAIVDHVYDRILRN